MTYYQEITIIPQIEIPLYFIWGKTYTQLHLALVEMKDSQGRSPIGISLPEYRYVQKKGGYLGMKLRVFAQDEVSLKKLDLAKWLFDLSDYLHCTGIREVPSDKVKKYAQYRRQHVKGSIEKFARRRAKRHNICFDEAMKKYQNQTHVSDLPYVQLKSLTNQQYFRLCIEKLEHNELIQKGFGTYGLSSISTVPEF